MLDKLWVVTFLISIFEYLILNVSFIVNISQIKLIKTTKILELNMNIEFGRVGLSTMITSWENYRIICVIPFSKKEGKEITPWYFVNSSHLKKSTYKGVTKSSRSIFRLIPLLMQQPLRTIRFFQSRRQDYKKRYYLKYPPWFG